MTENELKHSAIYETQLLTYLRMTGKKLVLRINFGDTFVKVGVQRVVHNL